MSNHTVTAGAENGRTITYDLLGRLPRELPSHVVFRVGRNRLAIVTTDPRVLLDAAEGIVEASALTVSLYAADGRSLTAFGNNEFATGEFSDAEGIVWTVPARYERDGATWWLSMAEYTLLALQLLFGAPVEP